MSYEYKGYNPANNKHVMKYDREHYHATTIKFDKSFFDDELKPYCVSLGVAPATLIKQIVTDYIRSQK